MNMFTSTRLATAMLALSLSLPVAAWAQTDTAPATAPAMQPAGSHRANVEQRIADMYATLKITPAQDAQWNDFAQLMLDNAQSMDALVSKDAGTAATRNAQQDLQAYADLAQQHALNVRKLSAGFDTLYAALSPEQKQTADMMFRTAAADRAEKKGG